MIDEHTQGLMSFLEKSPTAFHAVAEIAARLRASGFRELEEGQPWELIPGGNYFVCRNGSSILALKLGAELEQLCFQAAASHSDSPAFKVKENAQIEVRGRYTQLNTEGYGGMLCAPWLDRPLSVAGRVVVRVEDRLETRLVNVARDLLLIPNVAIHMNRQANDGMAYNKQVDLLPLFSAANPGEGAFRKLIAAEAGVAEADLLGADLFLYNRMAPTVWGLEGEFLSAPRLDDLQCAYATLQGFLQGGNPHTVSVYACFDNEEVGSHTKQGAGATFLYDTLRRVSMALGRSEAEYLQALASSFLLSCDNAHAVHPNHPEKTDANNCVYLNGGIVIKSHAGQQYASDAVSIALFRELCRKADVPVQFFANRSDAAGGSTLGNIAMSQVSMNCVDIGLAQLAMHSPYETAGVRDSASLARASEAFFSSRIQALGAGAYRLTR